MNAKDQAKRVVELATSYRAKAAYFGVFVFIASATILYVTWIFTGPINTIIYLFLFLFFAAVLPSAIGLFGSLVPNSIGNLHVILGAFAFGNMVLVQFDDKFDLRPATDTHVYIDGEWHEIKGGHTNWSVLGWRPFGMLRYKDENTLRAERADTKAERARGAAADGGEVTRGSFIEAAPPAVTGIDGDWVVDLKRVFSRGIKQIGDIDLIETAEEITSRKHASAGLTAGYESIIGTIVGLVLGIGVGYFMLVV